MQRRGTSVCSVVVDVSVLVGVVGKILVASIVIIDNTHPGQQSVQQACDRVPPGVPLSMIGMLRMSSMLSYNASKLKLSLKGLP